MIKKIKYRLLHRYNGTLVFLPKLADYAQIQDQYSKKVKKKLNMHIYLFNRTGPQGMEKEKKKKSQDAWKLLPVFSFRHLIASVDTTFRLREFHPKITKSGNQEVIVLLFH